MDNAVKVLYFVNKIWGCKKALLALHLPSINTVYKQWVEWPRNFMLNEINAGYVNLTFIVKHFFLS